MNMLSEKRFVYMKILYGDNNKLGTKESRTVMQNAKDNGFNEEFLKLCTHCI